MATPPKSKRPTKEAHIRVPLDVAERIQAFYPGIPFALAAVATLTKVAQAGREP